MNNKIARGRFAPSPTGLMHIGNARTALLAWLSVRSKGGTFIWRTEDLDTPRIVQGMAAAAEEDLQWMGIDWDEGSGKGGDKGPYEQSLRFSMYEQALDALYQIDRIFPCTYSRKDLRTLASAPHGAGPGKGYPVALRPKKVAPDWLQDLQKSTSAYASIRFKVVPGVISFNDLLQGRIQQDVSKVIGDYVVKRRDGMYAYQLAVVVDDIAMEVSEVVRGVDLLDSTARQIQLIEALGGTVPQYAHVPLVLNHEGDKLSKRDQGLTIKSLRSAGVLPEVLVGYLAYSLGFINQIIPMKAGALVKDFRWEHVSKNDWILPADLITRLLV